MGVLRNAYNIEVHGLRFEPREAASKRENHDKGTVEFWKGLARAGGGELLEQSWSKETEARDFAECRAFSVILHGVCRGGFVCGARESS